MTRQYDSQMLPYAHFEGNVVPFEEAKISIATHALQYGTGAFGGMRAYLSEDKNAVLLFRVPDHCRRLLDSAKMLRMDLGLTPDTLGQAIIDVVKKNAQEVDAYIRPFVYKSSVALSPSLQKLDADLAIYMTPMGDYLDSSRGQRVMVSSWARPQDAMIPSRGKFTGAYINAAFAKDQAQAYGLDDTIMLDATGKVAEGSTCNVFMVRNGVLVTTPITNSILEGITRRSILQVAQELGIPTEQRTIDRSELYIADEVFLCGTAVVISWIEEIDGRRIGDGVQGPIAKQLRETMMPIYRGASDMHPEWITKVDIR